MSIGRICTRVVATATPTETAGTVASRMADNNVGTVVVVSRDRKPLGILTDRDLVLRVMAPGLGPEDTSVEEIMSEPARTLDESTPIEQALGTMKGAGVRRLVVVGEEGALAGIVTVDDVLELLMEEVESIGAILREELPHIPTTA